MSEEKDETEYPLRSLHDFLSELDKEWDKFRTGSLIGVIVSCALLIFSSFRLLAALRNKALLDFLFMIVVVVSLVYTIYACLRNTASSENGNAESGFFYILKINSSVKNSKKTDNRRLTFGVHPACVAFY